MKRVFLFAALSAFIMTACDNKTEEKKDETATEQKETEVKVEGENGGSIEVNKEGVSIEGKDGGSLKVDENGIKIEGKDGGKVVVGKEDEKK